MRASLLPFALALCLAAAAHAQEGGAEPAGGEEGGEPERPGSDSPEAVTRARAREGFGPRKKAQAFLIPLDEKARQATGRVALAIERALSGARQYDVVDLAKALAADAQPEQIAKAQEARKKMFAGHEAFGARKFPEAALRYKEGLALFVKGLADSDAREQADGYLRLATAQKLAGDAKSAKEAFAQAVLLDPQGKLSPRAIDPAAEGPMLGARADVEANGTGVLDIEARPAGAKIFVDGQFKGNSPARLELPLGKHLVRIERTGFFPQAELVEVKGGKENAMSLTLQATPGASNLNTVIAGAVEEASRGTTGPQTSKLAEKFALERVLIGSVSAHGMKIAVMLALADPKLVKVLGKSDQLLVADGTDADQIEADTQSAARKLFALDTEEAAAAAAEGPREGASVPPSRPPSVAQPPQPTASASKSAQAPATPPPSYSGMMGPPPADSGARKPVIPGAAAAAPAPEVPADDPGLVAKERKVSVPATAASVETPASPGPADAPAPEKPAGTEEKKSDKKKSGIKGKSGTEKWGRRLIPLASIARSKLAQWFLFATVYAATAVFGLRFATLHATVSPVWPPTGVALAVLLLRGRWLWPGILLGSFAANAWNGSPPLAALAIACGNSVEAVLGATLLSRAGFHPALDRLRDVVALAGWGAAAATLASALVGTATLIATGELASDFGPVFATWWSGDAMGALVVCPLILAWARTSAPGPNRRPVELAALFACLGVVAAGVFLGAVKGLPLGPLGFTTFPFLVWAALRFDLRTAVSALMVVVALAVVGTARGVGAFGAPRLSDSVWLLETFLFVSAITTLLAAASTAEREEAAQKLRKMEQGLAQANKLESLGLLAGGVAHDFKNLLTGVLLNVDLARSDLGRGADLGRSLDDIETTARRAADLCRQLLAVAGKERLVAQSIDVGALVEDLSMLLRSSLGARAKILMELEPGLPPITGDATQVRQAVMNLLLNARDALPPGGGVIRIRTSTRMISRAELGSLVVPLDEPGPVVALSIEDDGEGMTAETRARLFEPFFSTREGGHGLGLSIVLGIVKAHQGSLAVESRPGEGARFTLLLRTLS